MATGIVEEVFELTVVLEVNLERKLTGWCEEWEFLSTGLGSFCAQSNWSTVFDTCCQTVEKKNRDMVDVRLHSLREWHGPRSEPWCQA
jgi:hypothetical protein